MELIVTVAIMGVLSVGIVTMILSSSSYRCKQAAQELSTALQTTKSDALAKAESYLTLKVDDGSVKMETDAQTITFGKNVEVYYTTSNSTAEQKVTSGTPVILTYARGSGSFKAMQYVDASGKYQSKMDGSNYVYCKTLCIRGKGSTKGYTITLYQETGKFECKKD